MERIACQVRYVFSSKNCVTEEETVGQRGSCSQTHTQDSGLTLKSITSRGKGELSLGELFLGLFLTHGFYITPPPTPTQLLSRKFWRVNGYLPALMPDLRSANLYLRQETSHMFKTL